MPSKVTKSSSTDSSKQGKRKRSTPSSNSVSGRGRKLHRKIQSDDENQSDFDSDLSTETNDVQSHSNKDYHSTLNELHHAATKSRPTNENERFNYRQMTKLSHENLRVKHFRDCLVEQEDRRFFDSINRYLDQFRERLFAYFTYMKSPAYREHIKQQLDNERELNKTLKAKVNCLENNIKILLEDAIEHLKMRTNELGIEQLERPAQLITYANDISNKHKELRSKVASLEQEIAEYDHENEKLSYILTNIQSNGHRSPNDNTYSTLLANMSRQTQQQETGHSIAEPESRTDFIVQKRSKTKSTDHPHDSGPALVSPIKIIKVSNKRPTNGPSNSVSPSTPSRTVPSSINNVLSSKQLEPVQVHSVISTVVGHPSKSLTSTPVVQTINVKTLLTTSPTSSKSTVKSEELRSVLVPRSFVRSFSNETF